MITPIMTTAIPFLNGSILPAAAALGGIIYFGRMYYKASKISNKEREKIQQYIINNATIVIPEKKYYVACAGSRNSDVCTEVSSIDIQACNFCDSYNNYLDLSKFNCYVVHGSSMKYAGINDNDLILVSKKFTLETLDTFPKILVLKYREPIKSMPLYKVRRAWYKGTIEDNFEEVAKKIMMMDKFQKLTQQEGFKDKEWMIEDLLKERLSDYKSTYFKDNMCPNGFKQIVISTTFDTEKRVIHFSIHPVVLIVGIVKESYTIKRKETKG